MLNRALMTLLIAAHAKAASVPDGVKGVIVATPGIDLSEAKAYATAHDKLLLSDYLELTRPGEEHDQQLRQKLERAQRAWLGGDIEIARTEFRALTELALKADWRKSQREAIQMAYLRLAQSAESGTEREGWLEAAARLYGDLEPNATFYPPPLLNDYNETVKRLDISATEVDLRDAFPDFRYVLIDGRKVEPATESRVRLKAGLHRFTALSDAFEATTEFLTPAQLRVLRLSPPALTEGACEEAALKSKSTMPTAEVYAGNKCPMRVDGLLKTSRFLSAPKLDAEIAKEIPDAPRAESNNHTWLWIVGAAVVAGAGYAIAQHASASQQGGAPEAIHHASF